MNNQNVKTRQAEKSLSRVGALAATAADELIKANEATTAIATQLICIQHEIEQLYITLEELLLLTEDNA